MIKIIDQEVKFKLVCNYCKIRNVLKILKYFTLILSKEEFTKKSVVGNVFSKIPLQVFPKKILTVGLLFTSILFIPLSSNFHLYFEVISHEISPAIGIHYEVRSAQFHLMIVVVDIYSCHPRKHF